MDMDMVSKEWLESEVKRLGDRQPWWHDIQLPHGVRTLNRSDEDLRANHNNVKWETIRKLLNVRGKTVVDLGCNEGYYCLEARRAGAARITGVDIDPDRVAKARFVMRALGIQDIEVLEMSAYDVTQETLGGKCDLALALGLLHRVPDPYTLIMKMGELADAVVYEWAALKSEEPIMRFWGGDLKDYDVNNTGYWRISITCVKEILLRAGFRSYRDVHAGDTRAILFASRRPEDGIFSGAWERLGRLLKMP
jgi:SAM-dependent methyltransferase